MGKTIAFTSRHNAEGTDADLAAVSCPTPSANRFAGKFPRQVLSGIAVLAVGLAIYSLITKASEPNVSSTITSDSKPKANSVAPQPTLPPLAAPATGEAFTYTRQERVAPFEIKAGHGANYLVKLVTLGDQPVMTVFVRGGETAKVDVPLGTFAVKYASGQLWYGYEDLFGSSTACSKASKTFEFQSTAGQIQGYTITLYKVPHGNLHTRSIKRAEF